MIKLILPITLFLLAGCQTNSMDLLPAPEVHSETTSEVKVAEEPRKLDVVHPDQFLGTTAPAGLDARPFQEELSNIAKAESKRIVQERIAEEKRLAEEQRIKEENERIAAEAEAARIAATKEVEAALAAEQAAKEEQQAANPEHVAANTQQKSNSAAPAPQSTPPAPVPAQTRTDGFNFKGHHFALSTFSGSGQVPMETPYVFQWTDYPKHYLIERVSPAGRVIQQVQMGDKITINGNTYTVHSVVRGVDAELEAWNVIDNNPSTISFQTCELGKGVNDISLLTLWFAS